MKEFKTYRIPVQSNNQKPYYLIMILDGTGSMADEYDLMIHAYKFVFKDIIDNKQVHAIQFGSHYQGYLVSDIEPYINGGGGNFNLAFENILEKLNEDIEADITICVVSDGHEPSDIKALKQQIDFVKKKYSIQFTSIAVGSGYPFDLFQEFRNCFHNGSVSCANVQFVERCEITGEQQCRKNFIKAFQQVKSQLPQKQKVQIFEQVWESITGQPTHFPLEGSVVASKADKLITSKGLEFYETRQTSDISEFIQQSCQEFLKIQSLENYDDSTQQAKEVQKVAQDLYKRVDQTTIQIKNSDKEGIFQIEKALFILEQIGNGNIDLKNLMDEDKTKLQCHFNPKNAEIKKFQMDELTMLVNQMAEVPCNLMIIKTLSNEKFKDSLQQARQMEYIAYSIFDKFELSSPLYQENFHKIKQFEKDLVVLDIISMGREKFGNLSDQDINKMLNNLNQRNAQIHDTRFNELTAKQLEEKIIQIINQKKEVYRDLINLKNNFDENFTNSIEQAKEMRFLANAVINRVDQFSLENIKIANFNKFIQQSEKDLDILDQIKIGKLDFLALQNLENTKFLWGGLNPQQGHDNGNQINKRGLDFKSLSYEDKAKLLWGQLNTEQDDIQINSTQSIISYLMFLIVISLYTIICLGEITAQIIIKGQQIFKTFITPLFKKQQQQASSESQNELLDFPLLTVTNSVNKAQNIGFDDTSFMQLQGQTDMLRSEFPSLDELMNQKQVQQQEQKKKPLQPPPPTQTQTQQHGVFEIDESFVPIDKPMEVRKIEVESDLSYMK